MAYYNNVNFNEGDLHTFQNFEAPEPLADIYGCQRNLPTGDNYEDQFICQPLFQGYSQNIGDNYQISFQNYYMKEHGSVFKTSTQNYMEFLRTLDKTMNTQRFQTFTDGLYDLKSKINCEELISMTGEQLSKETKTYLIAELKNYQKLNQFLNLVSDYCPFEIAVELIQIAYQVLQDFEQSEHKQNKFCAKKDVLALAFKRSRDLKNIKFLNFYNALDLSKNMEIIQKYNGFMEIFCSTVILTIAQFFDNPYYENEGYGDLKRTLSPSFSYEGDEEDEEDFEQFPQKKRKHSF